MLGGACRWEVVNGGEAGWTFQVKTTCAVREGEEALLTYVPAYPGWSFLLHCGFVPVRNPHESVRLFGDVAEAVDWYLERFPPQVWCTVSNDAQGIMEGEIIAKVMQITLARLGHYSNLAPAEEIGGLEWERGGWLINEARGERGAGMGERGVADKALVDF